MCAHMYVTCLHFLVHIMYNFAECMKVHVYDFVSVSVCEGECMWRLCVPKCGVRINKETYCVHSECVISRTSALLIPSGTHWLHAFTMNR